MTTAMTTSGTMDLRQLQAAFLESYLCSDKAAPSDLEGARIWRAGA